MSTRPGEFELISRFFAPLTKAEPGALGLTDDAAVLAVDGGEDLVISTDSLVAGVHFLKDDPAPLIAAKLLRVSLSDLAAMGARPWAYTLNLALPEDWDAAWLESFAEGLGAEQGLFGLCLVGGDTVAARGPLNLTITAFGRVAPGRALRRAGARPGDSLWVSGTIGDAFLGLGARKGSLAGLPQAELDYLISRFQIPRPRLSLGRQLAGLAHGAIDVSDGLIADLGHLCAASGIGGEVNAGLIPLSPGARRLIKSGAVKIEALITGGDDFELLFSAPQAAEATLLGLRIEDDCGPLGLTRIGTITPDSGVRILDDNGLPLTLDETGYRHF